MNLKFTERPTDNFYDDYELVSTWKFYKGYNEDIDYIPDGITINEMLVYDIFMNSIKYILSNAGIKLVKIGMPSQKINKYVHMVGGECESTEEYYTIEGHKDIMFGLSCSLNISDLGNKKCINTLELLYPPDFTNKYVGEMNTLIYLKNAIKESGIKSIADKEFEVTISMLNFEEHRGFFFDKFNISDKTKEVVEYDLFYGDGFKEFHNKLITRLNKDHGLVLFHGEPGTGKTFYIKTLAKKLQNLNENFLIAYTPISMIEKLNGPDFLNLLKSNKDKRIILLIEDAEEVIVDRKVNHLNTSVSNILNSTSGILNDIFGLSIIATFNIDLKNVDKALLRNERLLARKEFKMKSKEEALKIAKHLGVDGDVMKSDKNEFSIADITSNISDHEIILHGVFKNKKIGFGNP